MKTYIDLYGNSYKIVYSTPGRFKILRTDIVSGKDSNKEVTLFIGSYMDCFKYVKENLIEL